MAALKTPATRTRKPQPRTLNVFSATADGRQAIAGVTAGGKTADHVFTRTAGGWLVGPAELPDAAAYAVADDASCSCPAGRHGKPCKYAAAVAKLIALKVLAG